MKEIRTFAVLHDALAKRSAVIYRESIRINDPRLDPSPEERDAEHERRQADIEAAFFAEEPTLDEPPTCWDCGEDLQPADLFRIKNDPWATGMLCDRCRTPADGGGSSEFPEGSGG